MHLPNGSQIFIEASRGSDLSASAISNAEKPVFTMSDTGDLATGDYVIVAESTWGKLLDRVLRVSALTSNESVTLEGIDTTDTNVFPSAQPQRSQRLQRGLKSLAFRILHRTAASSSITLISACPTTRSSSYLPIRALFP